MKNKNKIVITVLIVVIVLLLGYVGYDKFLKKDNNKINDKNQLVILIIRKQQLKEKS